MKKLLLATTLLAATSLPSKASDYRSPARNFRPGTANSDCVVADPTDTPLNVRKTPNGAIVGALHNDTTVFVMEIVLANGKRWARILPDLGDARLRRGHGWVFFDHLDCSTPGH